ncbi:hypothetical protein [Prosthecobacter sp.]|uniref:hypothetical protein n=1 Tax=Prosthecobacter sp. TaxID=1965333 RepID=UPI003782FCEC
MHTKILLVLALGFGACLSSSLRGESAADLLDRSIWWPGDYGQLCRDDSPVGQFYSVPLHGYGTIVSQEYFLSKDTIVALSSQRKEIVEELGLRLKDFHWESIPPAPPLSAEVQKLAKGLNDLHDAPGDTGPLPGPRKFENPRALGATMLRIMEALQTVELLPELLRLEQELGELIEKADSKSNDPFRANDGKTPKVSLPIIQTGEENLGLQEAESITYKDEPNRAAVVKWKQQFFNNLVFQREILGVCLGMLEKKGYAPMNESLTGRLHALAVRRHPPGLLPGTTEVIADARRLVQDFVVGKEPPAAKVDGATLLEECIATPGSWNQMCASVPDIPMDVPMPPGAQLAPRHFNLGGESQNRLLAYRDVVMPVLVRRLQELKIAAPPSEKKPAVREESWPKRSGQTSTEFGPLIFQVVRSLNAVECLPEVLRLEQQLHELVAAAEKDASVVVPLLRLDSPSGWLPLDHFRAIKSCRIYQREMLGLMHTLLMQERYRPMWDSALEKSLREEGHAAFRKRHAAELSKYTSYEQIPYYLRDDIIWDEVKREAKISKDASYPVDVPYTEGVRDEVLSLTRRYLEEVPPEKRRAADGMTLPWYSIIHRR